MADVVTGTRARTADDATDPSVPVAATVVVLRDAPSGLEVLMIERPDRGSFAGAWVFPGGKLEPGDQLTSDELEEDVARRAGVRETVEETGLVVDPAALTTLSCWDPPPGLALRIRTWFFLAPAGDVARDSPTDSRTGEGAAGNARTGEGAARNARTGEGAARNARTGEGADVNALILSPDEAVAAEWIRPADALARHGRGELTLYPPTWVTLHALADHADTESAVSAARLGGIQRFETVARRGGEGPMLLWQGDEAYEGGTGSENGAEHESVAGHESGAEQESGAGHESAAGHEGAAGEASVPPSSGGRHRLEIGALPWIYTRSV